MVYVNSVYCCIVHQVNFCFIIIIKMFVYSRLCVFIFKIAFYIVMFSVYLCPHFVLFNVSCHYSDALCCVSEQTHEWMHCRNSKYNGSVVE